MTVQSHDNACMHSLSAQVSGEHEAQYEFKSVEYAVMCAENKLAQPLAVIAAGSGSAQVTAFDTFFSFEAQLRIGAEMVSAASDRAEGIRLWQEYVRAQARKAQGNQVQNPLFTPPRPRRAVGATYHRQCASCADIRQAWLSSWQVFDLLSKAASDAQTESGSQKVRVVGISANFYGAVKAGINRSKDMKYDYRSAVEARTAFRHAMHAWSTPTLALLRATVPRRRFIRCSPAT